MGVLHKVLLVLTGGYEGHFHSQLALQQGSHLGCDKFTAAISYDVCSNLILVTGPIMSRYASSLGLWTVSNG